MVAFAGIAATAFLFALQPVLGADNIFARQSNATDSGASASNSTFPSDCTNNCTFVQTLVGCVSGKSGQSLEQCGEDFCTTSQYNSLVGCATCVAAAGANATTISTIDQLITSVASQCASGGKTITGTSALPSTTGATTAANPASTTSAASKIAVGAFGVVITSLVGAIALL